MVLTRKLSMLNFFGKNGIFIKKFLALAMEEHNKLSRL